jgi:hypothetical protein
MAVCIHRVFREKYILLRDVRALGWGWLLGSLHTQGVQRETHSAARRSCFRVSLYRMFREIYFVARRSCARMGMVRHGSLHIQGVQRNTLCCETFVRSSLPTQDVQRNTFVARRSCAGTGIVRHSSLLIQDVQKYILLQNVRALGPAPPSRT